MALWRQVKVDKRFAAMFTDKNFSDRPAVDRYGRKTKAKKGSSPSDVVHALRRGERDYTP